MGEIDQEKVAIKAYPLGICAGVDYAWKHARKFLEEDGQAYIIGGNMVNNNLIVKDLRQRGGISVETVHEVPDGAIAYRTAHGGSDAELDILRKKGALVRDFTCLLVANVYDRFNRALAAAAEFGLEPSLLYVCKPDLKHREVAGVVEQFRDHLTIVPHEVPIEELREEEGKYYAIDSQTTMNVEEVRAIVSRMKEIIPSAKTALTNRAGICFATFNRQNALNAVLAEQPDQLLVFGSTISSNTKELVKIGKNAGVETHLLETGALVTEDLVRGHLRVAVSGGASVPIEEPNIAMERLAALGYESRTISAAKERDFFADKIQPPVHDFRNG
jgi:4-hydroxy-3-methylbut-2-en-1-yl diphosphate reductase